MANHDLVSSTKSELLYGIVKLGATWPDDFENCDAELLRGVLTSNQQKRDTVLADYMSVYPNHVYRPATVLVLHPKHG